MQNAERTEARNNEPLAGRSPHLFPIGNRQSAIAILLILALTFLVYFPCLRGPFLWDDGKFLTGNPLILAHDGLQRLWLTTESHDYFPLTLTALWFEWRLFGTSTLGYHVVNVLLHALSALLLWRLLARLKVPGAWLAGLLFAIHPVAVESVAWITELKNTLSMVLCLLSLNLYLRFETKPRPGVYLLALGAFLLALLSKTSVVMAPFVLLGMAWWQRGRIGRKDLLRVAPFLALSALLGLATLWFQQHNVLGGQRLPAEPIPLRIAGAGWAVWFYLYKAVLPIGLCAVYPNWRIDAHSIGAFMPLLLLAGTLALLFLRRKNWGRAPLFALGCFVAVLIPVLGLFSMAYVLRLSRVADHFQYIALPAVIALAAGAAAHYWNKLRRPPRALAPVLAAGVIALLGFLTWRQAALYQNSVVFWQAVLDKNPDCFVAHQNLGNALIEKKIRPKEALFQCAEAVRLNPGDASAQASLGNALLELGGSPQEAAQHLEKALALDPSYPEFHFTLGRAFIQMGKLPEAEAALRAALKLKPDYPEAHDALGIVLFQSGRPALALAEFHEALRLQPRFAPARYNLGNALLVEGETGAAIADFKEALAIQPGLMPALLALAWLQATDEDAQFRDGGDALRLARRAAELTDGKNAEVLDVLAAACAEAGRFDEAMATARKALALAKSAKDAPLAEDIRKHLECYADHRPWRETRGR